MIIYNLTGGENHPVYKELETSNGQRHYDFLQSVVEASLAVDKPFLSQTVLKAINFHAIACLHPSAGVYRPCRIRVGEKRDFPEPWQIPDLMDDFINEVNRRLEVSEPFWLAAYVLWRLNRIHPFINGNGRTARAACLFVLCMKAGGWLPFSPILPELIRAQRDEYVRILEKIDDSERNNSLDINPLIDFLSKLTKKQINEFSQ